MKTQIVQRQDLAEAMYPPIMGPKTGPQTPAIPDADEVRDLKGMIDVVDGVAASCQTRTAEKPG